MLTFRQRITSPEHLSKCANEIDPASFRDLEQVWRLRGWLAIQVEGVSREVRGKVKLAERRALWLMPVIERFYLKI